MVASVGIIIAAAPLRAEEFPRRKSGLWEIKTTSPAAKEESRSLHLCVDEKADDLTGMAAASAKKICSKTDIQRGKDRITVDSVCKFGETTATTHSVITGDFNASYRVETSSTYSPPISGTSQASATIDARWLGPCKPDQKPGDMILGNGTRINIYEGRGQIAPPGTKEK